MAPNSTEFQKSHLIIENKTADIHQFSREEFGLHPDWFLFMCPQNLFKLHYFFDDVVAAILDKSPNSHVIFTIPGRRKTLTQKFKTRLQEKLKDKYRRCHFLPRVSSEQFISFISIGDALLHPFPFDGSRISADSLTAGIPYVTLPSEYLKGRMGASFYRTMNIPELVARDVREYVEIAVRLSLDAAFMQEMRDAIAARSWLIFDDMEVPYSWSLFLLRAVGERALTWPDFLLTCSDRDVKEEMRRSEIRVSNQQLFDERWGPEVWLLDEGGQAVLEEDVVGNDLPRIFNNWNRHDGEEDRNKVQFSPPELLRSLEAPPTEAYEERLNSFQGSIRSGQLS
jgi:hypothetical protein